MWRKRTYGKYWIRMSKLNLKLRDNIHRRRKKEKRRGRSKEKNRIG